MFWVALFYHCCPDATIALDWALYKNIYFWPLISSCSRSHDSGRCILFYFCFVFCFQCEPGSVNLTDFLLYFCINDETFNKLDAKLMFNDWKQNHCIQAHVQSGGRGKWWFSMNACIKPICDLSFALPVPHASYWSNWKEDTCTMHILEAYWEEREMGVWKLSLPIPRRQGTVCLREGDKEGMGVGVWGRGGCGGGREMKNINQTD